MKLCLGAAQLGQKYGIQGMERPTADQCFHILRTAAENGVNMIDTSPAYGESEAVIGRFFTKHSIYRNKLSIMTKLPSFKGFENAADSLKNSLKALAIEYAEGVLLHDEKDVFNPEAAESLIRLKKMGYVCHTGVSIYSPDNAVYAASCNAIDFIQIPYNALDKRLDETDFFALARKNGKVVFARSAFLQGLLLMEDIPILGAAPYVRRFQALCHEHGLTPAQGCINYVSASSSIDYLVVGIDRADEIEANIRELSRPVIQRFVDEVKSEIKCRDDSVIVPSLWRKEA